MTEDSSFHTPSPNNNQNLEIYKAHKTRLQFTTRKNTKNTPIIYKQRMETDIKTYYNIYCMYFSNTLYLHSQNYKQ